MPAPFTLSLSLSLSLVMAPTISYPLVFNWSPDFYLSLIVFAIGILACIFFIAEWFRHRKHKFLLYWSFGFLALYWFQVPTILSNAGFGLTVSDFNFFYTLAFPLTFIGLTLIYQGVRSVGLLSPSRRTGTRIFMWILASLIFFAAYLLLFGDSYNNYVIEFLVVFLFFVPIHLLILSALFGWRRDWRAIATAGIRTGITLMTAGIILGLCQDFLALYKILLYPPQFWFVAIASFRLLFVLQAAGVLLLVCGFFFIHRGFKGMNPEAIGKIEAAGRTRTQ